MNILSAKALFIILFYLAVILIGFQRVNPQSPDKRPIEKSLPAKEQFRPSSDLIVPWRDGNCLSLVMGQRSDSGCYWISATEYRSRTELTLYTADAEVWQILDLIHTNDLYFGKLPKKEFVPFATPGLKSEPPMSLVLRISGESDHWYRVVVNEDDGSLAYVLKADPDWTKTTFEYWLKGGKVLRPANDQPPLLDAPNGKVIPESELVKFKMVDFIKLDKPAGEWAFVEGTDGSKTYKGWLRWRNGRKFLVDCYFAIKDPGW